MRIVRLYDRVTSKPHHTPLLKLSFIALSSISLARSIRTQRGVTLARPATTSIPTMLLFPLYAIVIWLLAAHWRRTWKAFAAVFLGTFILLLIEYTLFRVADLKFDLVQPKQALGLLIPFTFLVFFVGLFIACQKRPVPSPIHCTTCHYDLSGLNPISLRCPECGTPWRGVGSGFAPTRTACRGPHKQK